MWAVMWQANETFITTTFTNMLYEVFDIICNYLQVIFLWTQIIWWNASEVVFTDIDKAFIKSLYLIKGHGLGRLVREFKLHGTWWKDLDWTNSCQSCIEQRHLMVVVAWRLYIKSGAISLKLVCWQEMNALNTEDMAHCDTNSIDLECLKIFNEFYFYPVFDRSGDGVLFSIDFFVSLYLC